MKYLISIILISLFGIDVFSQDNTIVNPLIFELEIVVKDIDTKEPIPYTKIEIKGSDGSNVITTTDVYGYLKLTIDTNGNRLITSNTNYDILVSKFGPKKNYLSARGKESTVGIMEPTIFKHEYELSRGCVWPPPRLPWIEFEKGESSLKDSLTFLYNILVDNPTIVIQIEGGISLGEDSLLAEKRAEVVIDYLVKKGIEKDRLRASVIRDENVYLRRYRRYMEMIESDDVKQKFIESKKRTIDFSIISVDYTPKNNNK